MRRISAYSILSAALCGLLGCSDGEGSSNSSGGSGAHVGSRDCEVISEASPDPATSDACARCQNMACDTMGCDLFPCVDNSFVVQGCDEDADCGGLPDTPFCGMHSAPDKVCVKHDDL
jgi:hypothetical protein